MATAHLYRRVPAEGAVSPTTPDYEEETAGTIVLKRHVNIESVESWWKAARKALTRKEVPLTYERVEIDPAWIRFECEDGVVVFVDRKRSML